MTPPLPLSRSTTIGGRRVAWREAGSGTPLVLIHGIGGHSGSWAHQFAAFADRHRVIAWDAPGYGGSDMPPSAQPSANDYAGPLAGLLAELGADRPHMVGHSLGSIMMAAACRDHGVRPRSLTYLQPVTGSGALPPAQRATVRQARIDDMMRLGNEGFVRERGRLILSRSVAEDRATEAMEVMLAVPQQGYLAAWEMMCGADLFVLVDPSHPSMVVCGSEDPVCPPGTADKIAAALPGSALHRLENVGHYASIEAPERLNALLADFVAKNGG